MVAANVWEHIPGVGDVTAPAAGDEPHAVYSTETIPALCPVQREGKHEENCVAKVCVTELQSTTSHHFASDRALE